MYAQFTLELKKKKEKRKKGEKEKEEERKKRRKRKEKYGYEKRYLHIYYGHKLYICKSHLCMCMSTLSISITVLISRVKTRYIFHFELSLHQSSVRKWVVFLSHIAYVLGKATEYYLILWKYTAYIDSLHWAVSALRTFVGALQSRG